jgi:hypothetical protein
LALELNARYRVNEHKLHVSFGTDGENAIVISAFYHSQYDRRYLDERKEETKALVRTYAREVHGWDWVKIKEEVSIFNEED